MTDLDRWLIHGRITVKSPMQIRTGEKEREQIANGEWKDTEVLAIASDAQGNPYLPASTLKGAVNSRLHKRFSNDPTVNIDRLMGSKVQKAEGEDPNSTNPVGGKAEFWECHLDGGRKSAEEGEALSQTAINRKTRTADDAMLRTTCTVDPETVFAVKIMLDRAKQEDVELLLAGLLMLDGSLGATIGGGAGIGRGVCEFQLTAIDHMGAAKIFAWMQRADMPSWHSLIGQCGIDHAGIEECAQQLLGNSKGTHEETIAKITIAFDSPFLIAKRVTPDKKHPKDDEIDLQPLLDPVTGKTILTGSSVRGVLRAQAERIFRTVFPDQDVATKSSDSNKTIVEEIFGKTGWRGALQIGNFTLNGEYKPKRQDFVAIDRFTGGSKQGAKFALEASETPSFSGEVRLRISVEGEGILSIATIGLLCLLWRDAIEGDLFFGYGTNKGFGSCTMTVEVKQVPADALAKLLEIKGDALNVLRDPGRWRRDDEGFKEIVKKAVEAFQSGDGFKREALTAT